jgi:hypothetical protein
MFSKISIAVVGTALLLCAADVWKNPDYTKWSTEDGQKLVLKSPWAKETVITMGAMQSSGGSQGGRRGGGGGGGMGSMGGGDMGGGGGGRGGMGGGGMEGGGMEGGESRQSPPAQKITICWETAMPVRAARMKAHFGDKLPAKGEPGYTLDLPQNVYIVSVSGLRMGGGRRGRGGDSGGEGRGADPQRTSADRMKDQLMASTQLVRKGKDPIVPEDLKINATTNVVLFQFPKKDMISEEDRDVEFVTKVGPIQIKQKFSLKDMHFNGKLEL